MSDIDIDLSRFLNHKAAASSDAVEERIQMPLVLENVLRSCLKDAQERMEKGEAITPFSALAVGKTLFMEEHPGEDVKECFDGVKRTVENARGAQAYGFCYDGFIEVGADHAIADCLIAEGGCPGEPYGHAIGLTYQIKSDGTAEFSSEPFYVSKAMNYMLSLTDIDGDEPEENAGEGSEPEENAGEAGEEEGSEEGAEE